MPTIKPVGDCALTVEFENEISIGVNHKVHTVDRRILAANLPGIVETVPTYRTLIVHYLPEFIRYRELAARIEDFLTEAGDREEKIVSGEMVLELPVLYGGEVDLDDPGITYDGWDGRETGPDMEAIMEYEHKSREEIIDLHTKNLCYVYFQAFAIGHSYVGNPEKIYSIPRRATPRTRIPAGTLGVYGGQTVLNGVDLPCGWNLIGRTPVVLYDRNREDPSLVKSGQWIRFVPIGAGEYREIHEASRRGEYVPVTWEKPREGE